MKKIIAALGFLAIVNASPVFASDLDVESYCPNRFTADLFNTWSEGDIKVQGAKDCNYRYGTDIVFHVEVANLNPVKEFYLNGKKAIWVTGEVGTTAWYETNLSVSYVGPSENEGFDLFIVRSRFYAPQSVTIKVNQGQTQQKISGTFRLL